MSSGWSVSGVGVVPEEVEEEEDLRKRLPRKLRLFPDSIYKHLEHYF